MCDICMWPLTRTPALYLLSDVVRVQHEYRLDRLAQLVLLLRGRVGGQVQVQVQVQGWGWG